MMMWSVKFVRNCESLSLSPDRDWVASSISACGNAKQLHPELAHGTAVKNTCSFLLMFCWETNYMSIASAWCSFFRISVPCIRDEEPETNYGTKLGSQW